MQRFLAIQKSVLLTRAMLIAIALGSPSAGTSFSCSLNVSLSFKMVCIRLRSIWNNPRARP